jgi:L-seryl-tRNA(Ser) seleniumtransferase
MTNRRNFLRTTAAGALLGTAGCDSTSTSPTVGRDYFAELGVSEFINAGEPYTTLTGALMPSEAVEAYVYASSRYVRLNDLHDAIGKKLAGMIGCESVMITAGAASGLTLGTAACVTLGNPDAVPRLPDVTGLKSEVIIQKAHRYGYDRSVLNCGVSFVEVETREELEAAINENTAMMMFNNTNDPKGQIKVAEFAELGQKHGVPTFDDCAADVPPKEHLSDYLNMGFDLVTASGGKGIRGPQNAGLLLGRKDLIEAARLNGPPNGRGIGRGMKVSKETMLAMFVALETFLNSDHEADWREWERRVKLIADKVSTIPSVRTEMFAPPLHYHVPHLRIQWDDAAVGLSPVEVKRQLREGEPSIELRSSPGDRLELGVWMLTEGEAEIVADRLVELMTANA